LPAGRDAEDFKVTRKITLYALFGNPVGHSLSPAMHNAAYRAMGLAAEYLPFQVSSAEEALRRIREMEIRGASVTLPFKTAMMTHLDGVDEDSRVIGAVNTVQVQDGKIRGTNTDWIGFNRSLREHLDMGGKTFAVMGSSGAARAAIFGIEKEGGNPLILYRNPETGNALARDFGCPSRPLSDLGKTEAHCLINATPVGMAPHAASTLARKADLARFAWVMDMVYNPRETALLKEARAAGCGVIPGLPMLIFQGAEQIRIWTGMEPPVEVMAKAAEEELLRRGVETRKAGKEN
jgi:shikimate dehydrogenase